MRIAEALAKQELSPTATRLHVQVSVVAVCSCCCCLLECVVVVVVVVVTVVVVESVMSITGGHSLVSRVHSGRRQLWYRVG